MLIRRLDPLGVVLDHRRVRHAQLIGQVLHHCPRHIQRILQERPQEPHRAQLQREAQPVVRTTAGVHQLPVGVIEEDEPLQLRPRRHTIEARPYAATCSSLRNSTGTGINLRATPNPGETPAYRQPLFRCMSDPFMTGLMIGHGDSPPMNKTAPHKATRSQHSVYRRI